LFILDQDPHLSHFLSIPNPGSKIKLIPDPDPQHCLTENLKIFHHRIILRPNHNSGGQNLCWYQLQRQDNLPTFLFHILKSKNFRNFPLIIKDFVKDSSHPALLLGLKLHELQGK
jgi:hypothetical protein